MSSLRSLSEYPGGWIPCELTATSLAAYGGNLDYGVSGFRRSDAKSLHL
jgi:hypothetical protein